MSDLISEAWGTALRTLSWKATLCFGLLVCPLFGAGCSVRVFARVDDPVKAEGVSLALDDHTCDFRTTPTRATSRRWTWTSCSTSSTAHPVARRSTPAGSR